MLRRLIISPWMRQADLSRELGVSRAAIRQIWRRFQSRNSLAVRGSVQYAQLGLHKMFGWAWDRGKSDTLDKFSRWLDMSPFVYLQLRSSMSSMLDNRVYFEALLPDDLRLSWFREQLGRFMKPPYNLHLEYDFAIGTEYHMNLGAFDGKRWHLQDAFRFGTSMDATLQYLDILPVTDIPVPQIAQNVSTEKLVIASCLEREYYCSSSDVERQFVALNLKPPSQRTLRRRINSIRTELASPFVEIDNLDLDQRILVCVSGTHERPRVMKLLMVQARAFPNVCIAWGTRLAVLDIFMPSEVEWVPVSSAFVQLSNHEAVVCTLLCESKERRKALEQVIPYLISADATN